MVAASSLLSALYSCQDSGPQGPFSDPYTVMPSSMLPAVRGLAIKRSIVHCHSPYSHDACDDQPFIDGVRNQACFNQLRTGMCETRQDFVFLTDHSNSFAEHAYPDVLLYAEGDRLIERGGLPVANRVNCQDGHEVIVAAGTESGMMPIGIEHHLGDTPEERQAAYSEASPVAAQALQAAGALVFLQHTEGWDINTILSLPIDGIEIYNTHQNLMENLGAALEMLTRLQTEPERLPVPESLAIVIFQESQADLYRWAISALQRPTPGVLATDAHRNTFPESTLDGERLDSFRRMLHWFSNYVLVPPGELDDQVLKQAIGRGRLFGAFDYLGYPVGFDFHAEQAGEVFEMGDRVPEGEPVELRLRLPRVYRLDPGLDPPAVRGRILRAQTSGDWEEVESGTTNLTYTAAPGVYRAEVRMIPYHLTIWLGPEADHYFNEYIWIYSNPIYVGN